MYVYMYMCMLVYISVCVHLYNFPFKKSQNQHFMMINVAIIDGRLHLKQGYVWAIRHTHQINCIFLFLKNLGRILSIAHLVLVPQG